MLNDASLLTLIAIFTGGFLGGLARWALTRALPERVGTWAANVSASAVLGFATTLPGIWQFALGAGFAGALSTFSTLAKELGGLIRRKEWGEATKYALRTVLIGLVAAWFGMRWGLRGDFS